MKIGFPGLLTAIFITLKLLGKIDWGWWWVVSPLWIGFVLAMIVITFATILQAMK